LGETDIDVNRKIQAALEAGLRPILLVGEAATEREQAEETLTERVPRLFAGCVGEQVAQMVAIYEPERAIGAREPASPEHVAAGCAFVREWIGQTYGKGVSDEVCTIYGGSAAPAYAEALLASPEVDGLGASRKGRDPLAFAEVVRLIAMSKGLA
jgi:triosephosphate isomerase